VYVLENPSEMLARLDDYEGCGRNDAEPHEYERVQHEVVLETGERELAWVYVYRGSVTGKHVIRSSDYSCPTGDPVLPESE
jgi:gamma-glutamylcyclotransferase (GGCT)/AIG2-like uncharacterized protein YtfP